MRAISKITEKDIQNIILQYLRLNGVFCWTNHTTGIYDPTRKTFRKSNSKFALNGVSDILGVFKGKFLAIEVKLPTNKTRTEAQNYFIETINNNGGIAFYATSVEDVKKELGL